jgi:hypothetical protein
VRSDAVDVPARGFSSQGLPDLTAVPAARSRAATLKLRFALLFSTLVLAAFSGIFAAVAFINYEPPVVDITENVPRGRAVAELAAESFLSAGPLPVPSLGQPLPTGQDPAVEVFGPITWNSFTRSTLPSGEKVESHRFLFYRTIRSGGSVAEDGAILNQRVEYELMELTVLVAVPSKGDPALAARPFFTPAEYVLPEGFVADYTDQDIESLPQPATDQITAWATAWAEDDYERLKLMTGDTAPKVRYRGLGGFTVTAVNIYSALPVLEDAYLVRARVVLESANGSRLEMDMDLTVTEASTGLPKVSGWGPAGSGVRRPADVRVVEE